jgi:hypothetical protein
MGLDLERIHVGVVVLRDASIEPLDRFVDVEVRERGVYFDGLLGGGSGFFSGFLVRHDYPFAV